MELYNFPTNQTLLFCAGSSEDPRLTHLSVSTDSAGRGWIDPINPRNLFNQLAVCVFKTKSLLGKHSGLHPPHQ